jgi:NDP-sugar pyrophosphorylase family protein
MIAFHKNHNALATVAVQQRETSRYLLFDDAGELCGRQVGRDETAELVRPLRNVTPLAFGGIHVIDPKLLSMIKEDGVFSIITTYLRLAGEGKTIAAYRADKDYWRDLGKPESVAKAAQDIESRVITV